MERDIAACPRFFTRRIYACLASCACSVFARTTETVMPLLRGKTIEHSAGLLLALWLYALKHLWSLNISFRFSSFSYLAR
jgi:hypothetical protein